MLNEETLIINVNTDTDIETAQTVNLPFCQCPVTLTAPPIDATTQGRVVNFSVTVNNLCPLKPFIIIATVKRDGVVVGQNCAIVTAPRANSCTSFTQPFSIGIAVPLCANVNLTVETLGNYINCCG